MALSTVGINAISPRLNAAWRHGFPDKESRLAKIRMSYCMLECFLKAQVNHGPVETDAPKDLEVVGVYVEPDLFYTGNFFWVVCRSSVFDPVPEGSRIPEKDFTYWRID